MSRAEEKFDDVAAKATPVAGLWGLGTLLWSQVGTCGRDASDLDKRQCEGVRDARTAQLAGKTFLFTTGGAPVRIGKWNAKSRSVEVEITPCLACDSPFDMDGQPIYIVGQGNVDVKGGAIEVAAVHKKSFTFKDEAELATWQGDVMPRLRTEFVVGVDKAASWKKGGSEGARVEVIAWRVLDPCTGKIIAAKPASGDQTPDKRACGEAVEEEPKAPEASKEVEPERPVVKEPVLPRQLSPFQINQGMAPVRRQSMKCFDAYGVPGKASFEVTISHDGVVAKVVQKGDFVDTPTGACLEKAINAATFPKMRKDSLTFDFPVILQ